MTAVTDGRLKAAYIDTSCLVAIAFGERGARKLAATLQDFDELISSNLLESELRSTFHREDVAFEPDLVASISWLLPERPIGREMARVLETGYVRGADLWHLACALYLVEDPSEISFLTLDRRQDEVARQLGFRSA